MGAVVPDGKRAVNFWVVTAVVAGVATVAEATAVAVVFVGAAAEFAVVAPGVGVVATEAPTASLETCAAVGSVGSMPPFFFAPGPQMAVAMTPAVAKMVARVKGKRSFFFWSLKSLTPFKQSITKPICQFWNGVNFIHDRLNWIIQPIKVRALRGEIIACFQNHIGRARISIARLPN